MMRILTAAALLPALFLMHYIYRLDRIEKEPLGLLIRLVGAGALSCFPAAFAESSLISLASNHIDVNSELYAFVTAFLIVAICEEGVKFIALKLFTWNNDEFNCNFDGIVYAVFVSLGFAALENVMYVQQYGLSVAVSRAILSVPGHMTFSIFMGHYYSKAKKSMLLVRLSEARHYLRVSYIIAVLLHGFYDYCLMSTYDYLYYVFFAFVVILDILSIRKVKEESANDGPFAAWPVY